VVKVLFVCMGNICRSPTAEGVFRQLVVRAGLDAHIQTDSAGTHAYHVGEPPDERAQRSASRRGIDLSGLRARKVTRADFDRFDYVLAMDRNNYGALAELCAPEQLYKLRLMMEFAPQLGEGEVPDPYYGGVNGFERVLDMLEGAAAGLLDELRGQLPASQGPS
jgi:protein-tyrosine phosphatase